jgi:hypothetical protein
MKYIFLFIILSVSFIVNAQKTIALDEVGKHIGDSVKVCGQVYATYHAIRTENTPTFLNIGAKYPDQKLTIVIWGDVRKKFEGNPEEVFKNKVVCVIGKLETYKDKPQIVIQKTDQISISN